MNNLSWFLYLADFLSSLGSFLWVLTLILGIVAGLSFLVMTLSCPEDERETREAAKKVFILSLPAFFTPALLGIAIPSSQTLYLIAGSELGQQVVQTQEAKEIYEDIRKVIQSYGKTQ